MLASGKKTEETLLQLGIRCTAYLYAAVLCSEQQEQRMCRSVREYSAHAAFRLYIMRMLTRREWDRTIRLQRN